MRNRYVNRAEETKQAIVQAARDLFAQHGYEAVTMRQIAKAAGCSHTTIYIYFPDKEGLLHHLAMGPLQSLGGQLEAVLADASAGAEDKLQRISRAFIHFGLTNRSMYGLLFAAIPTQVDGPNPDLPVQRQRTYLFGLLRQAVEACIPSGQRHDLGLALARTHFFMLHGIVSSYVISDESVDELMARLGPTFALTVQVLLAGYQQVVEERDR